jgi:anti-sigma regulatory factor (Ser/Thr protein kinase)
MRRNRNPWCFVNPGLTEHYPFFTCFGPLACGTYLGMERRLSRKLPALEGLFQIAAAFAAGAGLAPSERYRLEVVLEELFVNCIDHGIKCSPPATTTSGGGADQILIRLEDTSAGVRFAVTDFGVEAFLLADVPVVDVDAPLAERHAGGLGLHLVRLFTTDLEQRYHEGVLEIRGIIARKESEAGTSEAGD